ncbi:MAG: hypothetical protein KDM81_09055, partial [Verrucomicrobiae bacterium]|nr:hypothetical protein [Verrucomicrobiae bacterium]
MNFRHPTVKRLNHRLLNRVDTTGTAPVTPGLKVMSPRDVPAGGASRQIAALAEMNDIFHPAKQFGELKIRGRVRDRIGLGSDEKRFDLARLDRLGQFAETRSDRCLRLKHPDDRLTPIKSTENRIHRRNERMNRLRLTGARHQHGLAFGSHQVRGTLANPFTVVNRGRDLGSQRFERARQRIVTGRLRHFERQQDGDIRHLARRETVTVIRHSARQGERRLDDVEAIHLTALVDHLATLGEFSDRIITNLVETEEIGVEREDFLGAIKSRRLRHTGTE